jgi:hyperosmotically inducible protein
MKNRHLPMVLSLVFATGAALLVMGCSRHDDDSELATTTAPTTTTTTTTAPTATTATTVGMEIDDTVVTTRVKSALIEDQQTKGFDIKVETRKGVVQLTGFVDNRTQADRAIVIAHAVEGAKSVDDGMTIKSGKVTIGNQVDDSVVTAKVKSALMADSEVKSLEIAVVTRKGEVQLSGFVGTQTQIDHAIAVTKGVEGVQSVVSKLSIKQ